MPWITRKAADIRMSACSRFRSGGKLTVRATNKMLMQRYVGEEEIKNLKPARLMATGRKEARKKERVRVRPVVVM